MLLAEEKKMFSEKVSTDVNNFQMVRWENEGVDAYWLRMFDQYMVTDFNSIKDKVFHIVDLGKKYLCLSTKEGYKFNPMSIKIPSHYTGQELVDLEILINDKLNTYK